MTDVARTPSSVGFAVASTAEVQAGAMRMSRNMVDLRRHRRRDFRTTTDEGVRPTVAALALGAAKGLVTAS